MKEGQGTNLSRLRSLSLGFHCLHQMLQERRERSLRSLQRLERLEHVEKKARAPKNKRTRIDWKADLQSLRNTNEFQSRYHMSEESFDKLVEIILTPKLAIDEKQSRRSTGGEQDPITPEMVVAIGLRFLGGELVKSLADLFGVSTPYTHDLISKFLDAVDTQEELEIKIPTTEEELMKCANEWDQLSGADGIFYGCVGAIDGWLCCTDKPKQSETNAGDYFSGHYQRHGLNVRAMCDAKGRFTYFRPVAPGRTNDSRAMGRCLDLRTWLQKIGEKSRFFIIGDNAYPLANHTLIPFRNRNKLDEYR